MKYRLFKLVIVDDENLMLDYLVKKFDWNKLGFDVVGSFYDGEEALDFIELNNVDVVLSDIRMNGVDGLQIMETLHKKYKNIKLVLISGYSDFEYMKKAIRNNVFDYILKPSTYEEISSVFKNLYNELNEDVFPQDYALYAQQQFFYSLSIGKKKFDSIAEAEMKNLGLTFDICKLNFTVVYIEINAYDEYINNTYRNTGDDFSANIQNILKYADVLFRLFNSTDGHFEIIALDDKLSNEKFLERIKNSICSLKELMFDYLDMNISVNYSEMSRMEEFYDIYTKCPYSIVNEEYLLNKVCEYVLNCDISNSLALIERVLPSNMSYQQSLKLSKKLIKKISDETSFITEVGEIKAPSIVDCKHSKDIQHAISIYVQDKIEQIRKNNKTNSGIIERVIEYIDDNIYSKITLESVAKFISFSPAYFSRFFRQQTGKKFIDYVTEKKMENAKIQIKFSDKKIIDISQGLGYNNMAHFLKLFKKYTGMTPTEFRNKDN